MLLLDPGCSVLKRALCAAHVQGAPYAAASVHRACVQRALHCALCTVPVCWAALWWCWWALGGPLVHTTVGR